MSITIAGLSDDSIAPLDVVKLFPDASNQALAWHGPVILSETAFIRAFGAPADRPSPSPPRAPVVSPCCPHPVTGSRGLSRRMRWRMARKSHRGTATSVIWKIKYRACVTTLAPILTSFDGTRPDGIEKVGPGSENSSQIGGLSGPFWRQERQAEGQVCLANRRK